LSVDANVDVAQFARAVRRALARDFHISAQHRVGVDIELRLAVLPYLDLASANAGVELDVRRRPEGLRRGSKLKQQKDERHRRSNAAPASFVPAARKFPATGRAACLEDKTSGAIEPRRPFFSAGKTGQS
jgi:hypothetical protein